MAKNSVLEINQEDVEAEIQRLKEDIQSYYLEHPDKDPSLPDKIFVKDMNELEEKITEHIPKKIVEDEIIIKNVIEQNAAPGDGGNNPLDFNRMREFDLPDEYLNELFLPNEKVTEEEQERKKYVAGELGDSSSKALKEKENLQKDMILQPDLGGLSPGQGNSITNQEGTSLIADEGDELIQELFGDGFFMPEEGSGETLVNQIYAGSSQQVGGTGNSTDGSGEGGSDAHGGKGSGKKTSGETKGGLSGKPYFGVEDIQDVLKELLSEGKLEEEIHLDDSGAASHGGGNEGSGDTGEAGISDGSSNDDDSKEEFENLLRNALQEEMDRQKQDGEHDNSEMINKIFIASSNKKGDGEGGDQPSGSGDPKKANQNQSPRAKGIKEVKEKIELKTYESNEGVKEEELKEVKVPVWSLTTGGSGERDVRQVPEEQPGDDGQERAGKGRDEIGNGENQLQGLGTGTTSETLSEPDHMTPGPAGKSDEGEQNPSEINVDEEFLRDLFSQLDLGSEENAARENEAGKKANADIEAGAENKVDVDVESGAEKKVDADTDGEATGKADVKDDTEAQRQVKVNEAETGSQIETLSSEEATSLKDIMEVELVVEREEIPVPVKVPAKSAIVDAVGLETNKGEKAKPVAEVEGAESLAIPDEKNENYKKQLEGALGDSLHELEKIVLSEADLAAEIEKILKEAIAEQVQSDEEEMETGAIKSDEKKTDEFKTSEAKEDFPSLVTEKKMDDLPGEKSAVDQSVEKPEVDLSEKNQVAGSAEENNQNSNSHIDQDFENEILAMLGKQLGGNVKGSAGNAAEKEKNRQQENLPHTLDGNGEDTRVESGNESVGVETDKQSINAETGQEDIGGETKKEGIGTETGREGLPNQHKVGRKKKKAQQKREFVKTEAAHKTAASVTPPVVTPAVIPTVKKIPEAKENSQELAVYKKEKKKSFLQNLLDKIRNLFQPKKKQEEVPKTQKTTDLIAADEQIETPVATIDEVQKEIHVEGIISRSVQGENIIVNPNAIVKQNVEASGQVLCMENSTILGSVRGQIIVVEGIIRGDVLGKERVIVKNGGLVAGNIHSRQVHIDQQAILHGSIFHEINIESEEMK